MFIESFEISNYKCFDESGPISLHRGMVVFTGQNGSGKTAALEALSLQFGLNPHRSMTKAPAEFEQSSVKAICRVLPEELIEIAQNGNTFTVPAPSPRAQFLRDLGISTPVNAMELAPADEGKFLRWFIGQDVVRFKYSHSIRRSGTAYDTCTLPDLDGVPKATRSNAEILYYIFTIGPDGGPQVRNRVWNSSGINALEASLIASRIYRFSPERRCAGASVYGDSATLAADASNLPEVLNQLQSSPKRFREYNETVSRVLPQVKRVGVRARGSNNQISVWFSSETERDDLAIPLTDCGTGVGHVLAILYVLCTSATSKTILIDEPQSFLHPGAARKLMEVLSEFQQRHQLVIATHSPTIISAGGVNQAICFQAGESSAMRSISMDDAEHRATLLNELGARLADVYGADNILWVEGTTEEECFPRILRKLCPSSLAGTAILAVRKTGDFDGDDAERAIEIHKRLSRSGSLLPPTLGFLFDRECRSDDKLKELSKKSDGRFRTIGRRCYENYLLSPAAIASVINRFDTERPIPLEEKSVRARLEELLRDAKYSCKKHPTPKVNRDSVDAAALLRDIFNEITECRVSFNKTLHSVELTNWVLEYEPENLRPLANILRECLAIGNDLNSDFKPR